MPYQGGIVSLLEQHFISAGSHPREEFPRAGIEVA
jgi:hypothetical protein